MCVDVHFLNDSRRDVEKLDTELHGQRPNGRLSAASIRIVAGRPIASAARFTRCDDPSPSAPHPPLVYQLIYDQK
jgi:hypothetical protein